MFEALQQGLTKPVHWLSCDRPQALLHKDTMRLKTGLRAHHDRGGSCAEHDAAHLLHARPEVGSIILQCQDLLSTPPAAVFALDQVQRRHDLLCNGR